MRAASRSSGCWAWATGRSAACTSRARRATRSPRPVELLNNLLYYVGRAESSGGRVSAVRASFRLSELLPVDESIEQERENLSAPSVKLMQTVAAAIREDLAKVKDVLDIFVRRGAGQPQELASQVEHAAQDRRHARRAGPGGAARPRAVRDRAPRQDREGTLKADESMLVDIAATLIGVEDRLDDGLVGLILPKDAQAERAQRGRRVPAGAVRGAARMHREPGAHQGGRHAERGRHARCGRLDSWQDLMRGMKAGLLLLGKPRAVEVIDGITNQLRRVMQPGVHVLPPGFVDRLADAIVSVEYYMETLQAGRNDPWYMLDNAQACVQALEQQATPSVPTVPPLEPGAYAKTVQISPPSLHDVRAPDAAARRCGRADACGLTCAEAAGYWPSTQTRNW